jgi:mRNA-degrading endonuclease YafQ of YafQ-DinJ toxin-antitoxin module
MIQLEITKQFEKKASKWLKRHLNLENTFQKTLTMFVNEPFNKKLETRKLNGELKNYWAFSINYTPFII